MKTKRKSSKKVAIDPTSSPESKPVRVLFTRRQLAARWNVCPHTIARNKDLRPVRFNKRLVRYQLENIEAIERAAGILE